MNATEQQSGTVLDDLSDLVFASDSFLPLLTAAVHHGKHNVVDVLLKRFAQLTLLGTAPPCTALSDALLIAADLGDAQSLHLLLDACSSTTVPPSADPLLGAQTPDGLTPLMLASRAGRADCVQLLLQHMPDAQVAAVSGQDVGEWNALMYAAWPGHTPCLELLLAHSPALQIAAVGSDGSTALGCAGASACLAAVKLLLAHDPSQTALDDALTSCCQQFSQRDEVRKAAGFDEFKACVELLLSRSAMLCRHWADECADILRPINQQLAARALVPGAANDSMVQLVLAARGKRKAVEAAQ